MIIWKGILNEQNGPFLKRSALEITVEDKAVVELNGRNFLKENVYAESGDRSSRFVVYYYQDDEGQGFCVFGDRSEAQDKIEEVREVAEAIMSTFRAVEE